MSSNAAPGGCQPQIPDCAVKCDQRGRERERELSVPCHRTVAAHAQHSLEPQGVLNTTYLSKVGSSNVHTGTETALRAPAQYSLAHLFKRVDGAACGEEGLPALHAPEQSKAKRGRETETYKSACVRVRGRQDRVTARPVEREREISLAGTGSLYSLAAKFHRRFVS